MTPQTVSAIETRNSTSFGKLWAWLRAIDDGVNYDPQQQLYESHKRLNQQVEQLQARVQDLEKPKGLGA